jgi:hypothetical protein
MRYLIALVGVLASWASPSFAAEQPAPVTTGELVVEPPTLISLGFEWYVQGDPTREARVEVSYRKQGEHVWKTAQPLFRLNGEHIKELAEFDAPNLFVGSIFDLEPNSAYECRLVMKSPRGVRRASSKIITVRTRAEPVPAAGGHVFHVYPYENRGPFQQPAFYGLYAAFYASDSVGADHYNVYPPRVQPGDTILVHAGVYRESREYYATLSIVAGGQNRFGAGCCGATWDGTYYLTASGTAEKPIVIKAAGDGEVVFDGADNHTLFNLMGGNYLYFEGITFRNTDLVMEAGLKGIAGSRGLTVKHCRFENIGVGIHSDWSGSGDFYIADNEFIGKANPNVLVPFALRPPFTNAPGVTRELTQDLSQFALKVYGSGNVVAFNRVRNFHDGIDFATYGLPDGYPHMIRDRMPVSNDFYNNDISMVHDDCIESDGALYNIRVMRNLCGNSAGSGLSTQPIWGLAYFIRNIVYHSPSIFGSLKLAVPIGAVFYHNTFLAAVRGSPMLGGANLHFANNLILAEDPTDPAFNLTTFTTQSRSDYNGFMAGAKAPFQFAWNTLDTRPGAAGTQVRQQFQSLAEYANAVHQDAHSLMVDYAVFADLSPPSVDDLTHVFDVDSLNFALAPTGAAVDKGVVLDNINDGFTGAAPDLGAREVGVPPPHYGPRT